MSLTVSSVSELDLELVARLQQEFTQIVQDRYPQVDVRTGPLQNLVLHLAGGIAGAINRTEIQRILDSRSILAISQDPNLSDPELVDHVLSNFGIERKQGAEASGSITFVIRDDVTLILPSGSTYRSSSAAFVIDRPFTAKPVGSQVLTDTDRVLTPLGGNTYSFTIPATAVDAGAAGNIRRGATIVPEVPMPRLVYAVAGSDFAGGVDSETNAAMISRLPYGVADKAMQGPTNIVALLRANEAFAAAVGYALIGFGAPEQKRDQHTIFPMSLGGRVDLYAKTATLPVDSLVPKTATLIERSAEGDVWQISIAADDAPGFYEIAGVTSTADPNTVLYPTDDVRGFDLSGAPGQRDVLSAEEAAYSRYQTAVVRFIDTRTVSQSLAVGAVADYIAILRAMPQIGDLQDYCDDPAHADLFGDMLVRAPVPCVLTIGCVIEYDPSTTPPAAAELQTLLAAAINATGFPRRLHSAAVVSAIASRLVAKQSVSQISMRGRIRRPDGALVYIAGTDVLEIPNSPDSGVTERVTTLIAYPDNLSFTFVARTFGSDY